jgi:hypothetical protein
MKQKLFELFEEYLLKQNIEFYKQNGGFIIIHNNSVNLNLFKSLPDNVQFNNNSWVDLTSLQSLPNNIQFNNNGNVYLVSLKSLPTNKYEIFKNDGKVHYSLCNKEFDPKIEKKPSNSDQHIYLYCKDWYKKTDIIEDFRIICAERCGRYSNKYHDVNNSEEVESCKVSVNDVLIVLTGIVWTYIKEKDYLFTELINDINPTNTWRVGYLTKECKTMFIRDDIESKDPYNYVRAVLYKYKSILKNLTVDDIKKISNQVIGEPNYELFPMFKKEEKIENHKS